MDPEALARVVPYPLAPAADDGLFFVALKVCRELSAPNGNGFSCTDQYRLDFTVPVVFEGLHGEYPLLEYINDDMGLCIGRELWSWPKKLGTFKWDQRGDDLHIECWRNGEILASVDFKADGNNEGNAAWPASGPGLTLRPISAGERMPKEIEVIRTDFPNFKLHTRTHGDASLRLHDATNDPLSTFFGELEVVGARLDVRDFDFDWGEVIATRPIPQPNQGNGAVKLILSGITAK
jgi:acetoacetate decarboxylase